MSVIPSGIARKHLTEDVIKKYEDAFNVIDEEGNGKIDKSELQNLVGESCTSDDVKAVLDTYGGGDDTMTLDEFLDFIYLSTLENGKKMVQESAGEDGTLDKDEYAKWIKEMAVKYGFTIPDDDEIDADFAAIDANGSGSITQDEMFTYLITLKDAAPAEED